MSFLAHFTSWPDDKEICVKVLKDAQIDAQCSTAARSWVVGYLDLLRTAIFGARFTMLLDLKLPVVDGNSN